MIALPCSGQVGEQLVNFELGAHVDAAGGFVENQDVAIAEKPLGNDDLLLVAAAQFDDGLFREPQRAPRAP